MKKQIKVGSDFSGVGAFDQALKRISEKKDFNVQNVFACDMDKFARQSYLANYDAPEDYPENVYDRKIPVQPLDIYMTSPPCQSFSLAGKRKGKTDKRGILFFNSWEFIDKNRPRFFIFENVKGLLSDDKFDKKDDFGRTFKEWSNMLGGKSVNGVPTLFPFEESVPYHIYFKVLNTKDFGVPQNRERVFIIGIRDDKDNSFAWPKEERLEKRLKDVLESDVDTKYFLSGKMLKGLMKEKKNFNGKFEPLSGEEDFSKCVTTCAGSRGTDNFIKVGFVNQNTQASQVFDEEGCSPTLSAGTHGYANGYVEVKSNTKKGFDIAEEGDSINYSNSNSNSKTRRGRVGKGVAQTLDTNCQQAVFILKSKRTEEQKAERKKTGTNSHQGKQIVFEESTFSNCLTTLSSDKEKFIRTNQDIRRLTPRECFRLQDFPDNFRFVVSDTQLYKQAGNSITVRVLEKILDKLPLIQ